MLLFFENFFSQDLTSTLCNVPHLANISQNPTLQKPNNMKVMLNKLTNCNIVTPQIPLGKSLHTNNHLHHESTNKIHKCPRVINLTKFGQSLPYSGNSTQNTTCAIIIHHSHWAHLSIKYFQYYPKIFLFTV